MDKKVQVKGKRGAKGKGADIANQETKEDLPAENGETKKEEITASNEVEEKEAKPCLISGPCVPSRIIWRNLFINHFLNASFLIALEIFFKRKESHPITCFKCK